MPLFAKRYGRNLRFVPDPNKQGWNRFMEFSRIITLLRKERGITQKQAAIDLGVSQALLSHYEKGIRECGLDFVVRVADYYGVSCDYLLGRSADRTGQTLSVEDIPNPESVKDNIYRGSVLPTMNKKLIANSMNILFDKLAACNDKAITSEVSAYLMLAVYKMFRLLYSAHPRNAQSLFSISASRWEGYSGAAMQKCEANVRAALDGEELEEGKGAFKDVERLSMTTETLGKEYPMFASSLLNLIKTSEKQITGQSRQEPKN